MIEINAAGYFDKPTNRFMIGIERRGTFDKSAKWLVSLIVKPVKWFVKMF